MKMVVVHVLAQCFGHGSVPFIGVDVLFTAYDFHGGFVGIGIELPSKFIAAVIVEVSGVYIKDQLAVELGIVFQTTGGDHALSLHLLKHFRVAARWGFEMEIVGEALRYNIRVGIGFFFTLIVPLSIGDFGCGQIHISCGGTVNAVISCHRESILSLYIFVIEGHGGGTSAEV